MSIANIGMAWGTDITVTPYAPTNITSIPYGLFTLSHSSTASSSKVSSGAITTGTNGDVITIHFETTKSDIYIKSITFNSLSNGTLSSSDGTISSNTFTASSSKNAVDIVLTSSGASVKGTVKITNVVIDPGTNDIETITFTSASAGTVSFTSSAVTSALTSLTSDGTPSVSSNILSWPNSKTLVFTSSRKLTYIALQRNDGKNDSFTSSPTGMSDFAWSGNSNTVTFTNSAGGGRPFAKAYIIAAPACTSITPTFSTDYTSTTLILGEGNSSTPAINKDGSSGTVTWESSDEDVATVDEDGVVTPVAAGSATITATVAANGGYCEGSVSKNFTINRDPVGEDHVLTWPLTTVSGSSESNVDGGTTDIGTGTAKSTSSYITNQTDLTGVGVKRTTTGKNSNTGKIETPTSYDAAKYVSFTFDVEDGYQFTPTEVSIKTVAVTTAKDLKFEFSDANGSYSVTKANLSTNSSAATNVLDFSECDVDFTGTVTVKIYVYGATDAYRLSTPLTIKGDVAAVSAATCTDKYSFHYGPAVGDWETPICFEKVGSTHEWNITNFTIPDHTNGQFWVGYAGSTNGQSATKAWTDSYSESAGVGNGAMLLLPTNGSVVGNAVGATGTLVIWDESSSKNQYVGFRPDGYSIRYSASDHVFAETATANMWETDVVTLPDVSTTYTMEIKTADGYTTCYHSNAPEAISNMGVTIVNGGKKAIYLVPGSFDDAGAKYAVYDVTNEVFDSDFMTDDDGDGIYVGYVGSNCSSMVLCRMNSDATTSDLSSKNWDKRWNQTANIGISGDLAKKYTITNMTTWNECAYTTANMQPITGQKGKFRMWANSNDNNWYVHWIPYYVLSYDDNGGSDTTAATERNSESSTLTVSVAANGFTAPTGKHFVNWNTAPGGGGTSYAPSASYSLTADATLYAQWAWNTYDVSTSLTNVTVSSGTTGTGAATHGSAYSVTLQGATGYNLPATVTVTIGGSPATLTTDYTWNSSTGELTVLAAKVTGDISISATGAAQVYDITYKDQGGSAFSGEHESGYPTTHTYASATTLKTATKTGYTFGGWYTSVDCSTGLVTSLGATTFTADITLYAKWTANSYDVTHTLSNVTTSSATTATYGTNYTATFSASSGYELPDDITVTIGGASTTHYTWNASTGALTIDGAYILGDIVVTIVGESEGCTPQTVSKVVVTGSSAGTTSGYNEKEYVGTPVINVSGKTTDATNIDGKSGDETGYKMSSDGNSIVFATLSKGTFQEGDTIKIGITRRNDTRVISSNKNVLTIYYGTNKDDADSLTTISTGSTTTSGASEHEGAGFYKYTLTAADVTKIGSKKGIGLFRASSNGENPYVYSVEIIGCRDWTTCTAPTAVSAGTITSNGATFTITDAENTDNYELYISESSTAPTADATPTATSSSKTKVVSSLSASTTYYYWVRSDCGGYKSDWVAGASTFTTSAAATTYSVTYDGNGSTGGSEPTDATAYEEGDVVIVKANTGSLVKTGQTFLGWSTSSTASSGTFYPAEYKFAMGAANVTLYAVWGSTGAQSINIAYFETSQHNSKSSKPDAAGKYLYGYTKSTKTIASAYTMTTSSTNNKGQGTGDSDYMRVDYGTTVNIYADTVTVSGTPAGFDDVTSVSVDFKMNKSSYYTTFDIYVGSTKIADNVSLEGDAQSSFTTFTYSGLSNLDGVVKIVNKGSGSTNYNFHIDNIVINYGSGAATGFDVTFNMNGHGSEISKIENVPSGSKIGAPIPVPTATGYEFGGWYREAGCSNEWNFGSNTITKDTTLFAKWTTCAPTISVHPSGTIYNQGAAATALSVTAATNDGGTLEYQWYSNEEDSNEDGTEIPGATSASYTPSTALVGTIYYYCVVTNDCGNVTSNVAAITVNDSKPNPTASWTIATPTHGGKGFSFSVTAYKNDGSTAWDGTLTTAMLSASEDVVLSGVTVSDNTISGTYGVKASATSPVTFYLELPSTTTQAAATLSEDKEFTACSGTGVDGSTYEVPVTAKYSSSVSGKPSYLCETTYGYISPELGTSSVSLKSQTYDDFEYWMNSGRTSVLICTKVDAVKKIQIYLSANGGAAKVTNVYTAASYSTALKDYTALDAKSDYTVTYTDESGNSSIAKGENGHVDIAFTTNLDSGTVVYVALKDAAKFYGAKLTTGAGSGATIDTELAWSNSQSDGATVVKGEDDAEFTITATHNNSDAQASLGEIRYSSSDTKIATVNATTGEVTIADTISFGEDEYKTTTIKATLVSSGCYKSASITYTLQVNKSTCTEAAGTVAITSESDCSVELTVSGYEDGATIQWQKDGSDIPSATSTTYTATTSGTYTAVTHKTCDRTSNSIVVAMSATATASKIVDSWYVKNGRRTPDIALVQTTGATSFTVKSGETTIWDEANTNTTGFGGCDFELKEDGIIYLHGTKSNGDAPSDLVAGNETITVTVSGCGGALSGLDIIIKKQAETLKPSVAFVVDGTTRAKGGTATSVSTAKTSERPLWTYLSSSFTLTGCNIYWSVDSKELREYYSQYDAIVVTDDPKTQTTGAGGVEYVKAFGTLVDVRPILTMEAYVGRYTDGGWHVYNATPTSPNPRQVEMKLECKTHEIFAGVNDASDNVRTVTVNGDDYWYITIVDTTQSPYKGTTMDYKDLPALQGFDPSSFSDMLGIGTIHDDALQAGVERQQEPAARMMILGIQNNAMGALTNEGKLIIKNAISYLLKTNMEEVDDCSNYFTGATNTDWNEPTNWSKNSVPDFATKVRIMAPVVISDGQKVRASQVDIVVDGTSSQKDGKPEGTVTINPGGALVVGGTVNRAIAPHYGIDDLEPTTSEDLIVQANEYKSAALILDNSSGLTGATVQMYSSSFWELVGSVKKKYWSYVAVPIQEALIPDYFYGAFTYYYEEKSGWEKKWDGDYLYPFQGIGLSRDAAGIENFWGPLVSTENRDIKLTKTAIGGGENLIANSWTAPIQIANFDADDFGDALATIYIYNTGNKDSYAGSTVIDANTTNQGAFTAGQWLGIPIGVAKLPEYTGLKVIPAMQTFEVDIPGEAPNGTETTLHLDYDRLVRGVDLSTDNLTEKLHAPKRSMNKNDGDVEAVMKVRVAGVHTLAEVWLIQDGAFGEGFDNGWEAYYAACDDRSPQLYAHSENGNMGIIAKQELEGTILGFAPSRDGADYTFSFYYRGDEELYLNDLLMETSTPITNEDTYSFTSSNNGNSNRFIISRNPYQSPLITTGTEEIGVEGQNSAKKIIYNDKIYILYNGVIYDAMGKVINRK